MATRQRLFNLGDATEALTWPVRQRWFNFGVNLYDPTNSTHAIVRDGLTLATRQKR